MLKFLGKRELLDSVSSYDGIILYGVGKRLVAFFDAFKDNEILSRVLYCVDKDEKKIGVNIVLKKKAYEVRSFNSLFNEKRHVLVIITPAAYADIVQEFKKCECLNNIDYISFSLLGAFDVEYEAMHKSIPADIKKTKEPIIPKVIHYCWFGKNPIPEKYLRWMDSWSKYCPDYEIKLWNEDNYDVTKNKYMYEAYKAKKWGFVPDYARLDIIYNEGGVYFDTDVELIANIDDLLYQKGFAGFESDSYVAFGLGFGAVKGLPIIKELRDSYDSMSFIGADGSTSKIASPVYQTDVLKKHGLVCNGEYQTVADITLFPQKMFSPKSCGLRVIKTVPYTKSIHHYDGSWLDDDAKRIQMANEDFAKTLLS